MMDVKIIKDPRGVLIFVDGNEHIYFNKMSNSSRKDTLTEIINGTDHILSWLQDHEGLSNSDIELKNKYLNEIRIVFRDMKRLMYSITDLCVKEIRDTDNISDKREAEKIIFARVINGLRDEFYDMIVYYIKNNTVHNTETDDAHLSLTEDIIAVYASLSTVLKIVYFYFMSMCSSTFKVYCASLTFSIVKRIQEAFLRYYYMRDRLKYNEIIQQDFVEIIYEKTHDYAVKEFPDESLVDKFTIAGYSRNLIINEVIDEILLTINKFVPIKKSSTVLVRYTFGEEYSEYALTDLAVVKYIQTILKMMVTNKFRVTLDNNITKINTRSTNDTDQYKQELLMRKTNTVVAEKKKEMIEAINNFLKKFFSSIDEIETDIPNLKSPLNEYLVTSFIKDAGGHIDIIKIMDDAIYDKILKYIAHILMKNSNEFADMVIAIFCESNDRKITDAPVFKEENLNMIRSLSYFVINPQRILSVLYNVTGRTYTNVQTKYIVNIEDTFIKYVKLRNEKKIKLVNDYIFDYETVVEEGAYVDSNEYSDEDYSDYYSD